MEGQDPVCPRCGNSVSNHVSCDRLLLYSLLTRATESADHHSSGCHQANMGIEYDPVGLDEGLLW